MSFGHFARIGVEIDYFLTAYREFGRFPTCILSIRDSKLTGIGASHLAWQAIGGALGRLCLGP